MPSVLNKKILISNTFLICQGALLFWEERMGGGAIVFLLNLRYKQLTLLKHTHTHTDTSGQSTIAYIYKEARSVYIYTHTHTHAYKSLLSFFTPPLSRLPSPFEFARPRLSAPPFSVFCKCLRIYQ